LFRFGFPVVYQIQGGYVGWLHAFPHKFRELLGPQRRVRRVVDQAVVTSDEINRVGLVERRSLSF
jgi:hypothetical protein